MPNTKRAAIRYVAVRAARGEFTSETVKTVTGILRRFTALCPDRLGQLDKRAVLRWWNSLDASPGTCATQLGAVRAFLGWCVEEGYLRGDPSRGIRTPKRPRRHPRTLAVADVAALIIAAPDSRGRLVVMLEVQMGLRAAEVAGIEIGDIDFARRLIVVHGKGNRDRVLPIPAEAWRYLQRYLGDCPASSGPLIRSYLDEHRGVQPHYLSALMREWMVEAGVKAMPRDGVSGHALRRTCATDMLDRGANIREVQNALGHASLATTQHYLGHRDGAQLAAAMEGRSYGGVP